MGDRANTLLYKRSTGFSKESKGMRKKSKKRLKQGHFIRKLYIDYKKCGDCSWIINYKAKIII